MRGRNGKTRCAWAAGMGVVAQHHAGLDEIAAYVRGGLDADSSQVGLQFPSPERPGRARSAVPRPATRRCRSLAAARGPRRRRGWQSQRRFTSTMPVTLVHSCFARRALNRSMPLPAWLTRRGSASRSLTSRLAGTVRAWMSLPAGSRSYWRTASRRLTGPAG